jgi:hypothetical protein
MRAPGQAPKTSLKLFGAVPSLLQAHPLIDTLSLGFLEHKIIQASRVLKTVLLVGEFDPSMTLGTDGKYP